MSDPKTLKIYKCWRTTWITGKGKGQSVVLCKNPAFVKIENHQNVYCVKHLKEFRSQGYQYRYVLYMFPFTNSNKLGDKVYVDESYK